MAEPLCVVDSCGTIQKVKVHGYCGKHYQRFKKFGTPTPDGIIERDMSSGPCSVEGCPRDRQKRGFCGLHYQRWKSHGDAYSTAYTDVSTAIERFCARCNVDISSRRSNAIYCGRSCKSTASGKRSATGKARPTNQERYQAEKARRKQYAREQYWADPERSREYSRKYRSENRDVRNAQEQLRKARKLGSESRKVTARDLRYIKNRQQDCCYYCGTRGDLAIDHVIPLAKGGRHAIGNLVGACQRCNSQKCAMLLIEWRAWLKRKGVSLTL